MGIGGTILVFAWCTHGFCRGVEGERWGLGAIQSGNEDSFAIRGASTAYPIVVGGAKAGRAAIITTSYFTFGFPPCVGCNAAVALTQ